MPLTVYMPAGQSKHAILDGERRYKCCCELSEEGHDIRIPANVVDPPSTAANLLYMFSIHSLREQWELMPTALSLKAVMEELKETDVKTLAKLTGASEQQLERCMILLQFPERFQALSLLPDKNERVASNFWIEAHPVLSLCEEQMPEFVAECGGRDNITDRLVAKKRAGKIKSVIHFRRILEAFAFSREDPARLEAVKARLREYILNMDLETRMAFDEFVTEGRQTQTALNACTSFRQALDRYKLEYTVDQRQELVDALEQVRAYVDTLLARLAAGDEPAEDDDECWLR